MRWRSASLAAVILVTERHAGLAERDQAAVRNRDPVGVAREIGEDGLGPRERRFGVDDPSLSSGRCQMTIERASVTQAVMGAEELEAPAAVKLSQTGQEKPPEQFSQHTDRQQERRPG